MLDDADEAAVSPDGQWLAFQEGDNVYVTPLSLVGTGANPVRIDKRRGRLPVTRSSTEGGIVPALARQQDLEYPSGPRYYACDADTNKDDDDHDQVLELTRAVARAVWRSPRAHPHDG